ncbi:hypothetical protein SPRG_05416 [Saprolegnia parasitica CBS 223.65]|uniref:Uncharacterized protein n=1 Tax=Saprolegnia parasitica (strain CBS 223.65) TaxID=695850 RepID=A0A067CEN5_SAPPC|nr:hypothetical protein SPRG_05416 [Saprolegnia parasitica CBS 223.65]KDO29174.1 hypothetical protein SPRG_05416 [Saprolegnia parasitica CBS 223.65]|eukprot:XP_012200051.1 hypothetical protein SPRG_05416 [Saprolegnia parasitica CBS 223.65]
MRMANFLEDKNYSGENLVPPRLDTDPKPRTKPNTKPTTKRTQCGSTSSKSSKSRKVRRDFQERPASWEPQLNDGGTRRIKLLVCGARSCTPATEGSVAGGSVAGADPDTSCFQNTIATAAMLLGVSPTWKGEPTNEYIKRMGHKPADGMPACISRAYVQHLGKAFGFKVDMAAYDYNLLRGPPGANQPIRNSKRPVDDLKKAMGEDGVYLVTTRAKALMHTFIVEWKAGVGTFYEADNEIGVQLDGMDIPALKCVRMLRLQR